LDELNGEAVLNKSDFPHLKPKTHSGQASLIEMFCTFIFVSGVLLVKDQRASRFTTYVDEASVSFFGCAIIALTLTAMILFSGAHTGASINPAVSISQTVLASYVLGEHGYKDNLWKVYLMGPTLGGVFAGLISWVHGAALRDHGPLTLAEKIAMKALEAGKNKKQEKSEEEEKLIKADNEN